MSQTQLSKAISNLKNCHIVIILAGVTLFFFRDIIFGGHLLWGSDFITTYLPYKQFLYEEIKNHGFIPLWNPYLFGGMPFWGFFESTIFYPVDLLFWIIPPEKAYGYTMAIHIFMGGLFMYMLCGEIGLSKLAGLFAAIVFSYNHFVIPLLSLGHMVLVQSYIWAPIILYFFIRSAKSERYIKPAFFGGLCWGLQILAADPQTAFYTFIALSIFGLVSIPGRGIKNFIKVIKILCVVFFMGVGLSAINLVPSIELVLHSTRGIIKSYQLATLASFPPQGIITILMPHFFGNLYDNSFWVKGMPFSMPEFNLYLGIVPLFLIFVPRHKNNVNEKIHISCIILIGISLVLSMGNHTPFYKLAYELPGFSNFRAPSKIIVLWMLGFSIIAASILDNMKMKEYDIQNLHKIMLFILCLCLVILCSIFCFSPEKIMVFFSKILLETIPSISQDQIITIITGQFYRMIILFFLCLLIYLLGIKRIVSVSVLFFLMSLLVLTDLMSLNHRYILAGYDEDYEILKKEKIQISNILKKDEDVFRVGGVGSNFGPNIEMYHGLQTVTGAGPLILDLYYLYCDQFYNEVAPYGWAVLRFGAPGSDKFMDMLNVKYNINHKTGVISYRDGFLPRAMIVPRPIILPELDILSFMEKDTFDPTSTVILEQSDFDKDKTARGLFIEENASGTCEILHYRPDSIKITVKSSQDSFLVLNDIFYPGWKCYVDGVQKQIYRANFLFRGIGLNTGDHEVFFKFKPLSVKIGMIITVITLFIFFVLLFREFQKKA